MNAAASDAGLVRDAWSGPRLFDPARPRVGWRLGQILDIRLNRPRSDLESRYYLLGRMIYRFHLSPLAVHVLARLMEQDILLHPVDEPQPCPARYDPETGVITLDVTEDHACMFGLIREARLAWMMQRGLSSAVDGYNSGTRLYTRVADFLILHRMIEADQDLHALIVAAQMAHKGDIALWAWCHDVQDLAPVARMIDHQGGYDMPTRTHPPIQGWFDSTRPAQCDDYMLDWLDWLVDTHQPVAQGPPLSVADVLGGLEAGGAEEQWARALWDYASHDIRQRILPVALASRIAHLEPRFL